MQGVRITGGKMRIENGDWVRAKEDLIRAIKSLGFREDLGKVYPMSRTVIKTLNPIFGHSIFENPDDGQ